MKAALSSLPSGRDHSLKQQSFGRGTMKLAENGASPPEIFSHACANQFSQLRGLAVRRGVRLPECPIGDLSLYEQCLIYIFVFLIKEIFHLS